MYILHINNIWFMYEFLNDYCFFNAYINALRKSLVVNVNS